MAPTALLSSWGAGRPEPRGHPYGSCNGERAAQVPRDATHTLLCAMMSSSKVHHPPGDGIRWHPPPRQALEPNWVPVPQHMALPLLGAVEQERKAELWSPSP